MLWVVPVILATNHALIGRSKQSAPPRNMTIPRRKCRFASTGYPRWTRRRLAIIFMTGKGRPRDGGLAPVVSWLSPRPGRSVRRTPDQPYVIPRVDNASLRGGGASWRHGKKTAWAAYRGPQNPKVGSSAWPALSFLKRPYSRRCLNHCPSADHRTIYPGQI